jgi:hypothetical protein
MMQQWKICSEISLVLFFHLKLSPKLITLSYPWVSEKKTHFLQAVFAWMKSII